MPITVGFCVSQWDRQLRHAVTRLQSFSPSRNGPIRIPNGRRSLSSDGLFPPLSRDTRLTTPVR